MNTEQREQANCDLARCMRLRRWEVLRMLSNGELVVVSRHWSRGSAMAEALLCDQRADNRDRRGNLLRTHKAFPA